MNNSLIWGLFLILFFSLNSARAALNSIPSSKPIEVLIDEWYIETAKIQSEFEKSSKEIFKELSAVNSKITSANTSAEILQALVRKDSLKEALTELQLTSSINVHKIKYIKGLQIIKLLYEKSLSLDHHFSSVATFNDINKISNPNSYPEFEAIKSLIDKKKSNKAGFNISGILGENIYTSLVHSFVSLFNNKQANKADKDAAIEEVECILDFTLQMHNELNTIYFETKFLERSNQNVIDQLRQLFVDFTKPINYSKSIEECRAEDDWDEVRNHLSTYLDELQLVAMDDTKRFQAYKMEIELKFPIDRLLQFIIQYNAFIEQGSQFYEKFGIMLNSYQNKDLCSDRLPQEFIKLNNHIQISIEKFNSAYKPVEINGSKMKEILYGLTEYD